MELLELAVYGVALVLGYLVFRLASGYELHWALGLVLALVPLGLTILFGIPGLLLTALAVGAAFKAAG